MTGIGPRNTAVNNSKTGVENMKLALAFNVGLRPNWQRSTEMVKQAMPTHYDSNSWKQPELHYKVKRTVFHAK